MKLIKGFITVIGIIGILVIIALVTGYYLYLLTPPIQAEMYDPGQSRKAFESFNQKFESFETEVKDAVDAGEEKELSLVITEKEINSKLIEVLAEGELPLREILVNFGKEAFMIYAKVDVPGVDARIGAKGQIQALDGGLKVAIEDFDLGKLPLPQAATNGVEEVVNIMLKLRLADWPLEITNVEISNRELTVVGLTRTAD